MTKDLIRKKFDLLVQNAVERALADYRAVRKSPLKEHEQESLNRQIDWLRQSYRFKVLGNDERGVQLKLSYNTGKDFGSKLIHPVCLYISAAFEEAGVSLENVEFTSEKYKDYYWDCEAAESNTKFVNLRAALEALDAAAGIILSVQRVDLKSHKLSVQFRKAVDEAAEDTLKKLKDLSPDERDAYISHFVDEFEKTLRGSPREAFSYRKPSAP